MPRKQVYIPFILAALLFLILLSSCVATKGQRERFLAAHCVGKDSVVIKYKDTTIVKHDTIKLSMPGPIQYLENPCKLLCDSLGNLKNFTPITKKENGSKGTIFKVGNSIGFKCDIDSAKVAYTYNEKHTTKETISKSEKVIQKPCELEHKSKFDGFTFWWFWITASIIALYIIVKILKGYLKTYLPFLK